MQEPFEPERDDEQCEEKREREEEPDREPETARNPGAKTSSGNSDEIVDET